MLAVVLLTGLFSAKSASAGGGRGYKTLEFKARVQVQQITRQWTHSRRDSSRFCDVQAEGKGTQQVDLDTGSQDVTINIYPGAPPFMTSGPSFSSLAAKVTVDRQGEYRSWSNSTESCASGTEPDTYVPPPPDCGYKELQSRFGLGFPSEGVLELGFSASQFWEGQPYENCANVSRWPDSLMRCTDNSNCEGTDVTRAAVSTALLNSRGCKTIEINGVNRASGFTFFRDETESYGNVVTRSTETTDLFYGVFLEHTGKRYRRGHTCIVRVTSPGP